LHISAIVLTISFPGQAVCALTTFLYESSLLFVLVGFICTGIYHQSPERGGEDQAQNTHEDEPSHHPNKHITNQQHGIRAAHYDAEPPSERAYFQAQETIYTSENELSACRLLLEQIYHVAVLDGAPTEAALQEQIEHILYAEGTPTQLPDEVLIYLFDRRAEQSKTGPWMEGHYRPGKAVDVEKKKRKR
jgi:hypothetical protein